VKRLIFVLLGIIFLTGCGAAARESGFYEHNTMYRDWDHLKFSTYGYKQVDSKEIQQSAAEDWWGISVEGSKR
jgi:hypothetical protein